MSAATQALKELLADKDALYPSHVESITAAEVRAALSGTKVECLHRHIRTLRSWPPKTMCLDCDREVRQGWILVESELEDLNDPALWDDEADSDDTASRDAGDMAEEPCPDCAGDPDDPTLHHEDCPRCDTTGQFGPPWLPGPWKPFCSGGKTPLCLQAEGHEGPHDKDDA